MTISVKDMHDLTLGNATYWLRTPTPYDMPRMRQLLARQGVRRPSVTELRVAALAGVEALAAVTGQPEVGADQRALIERWYELLKPVDENDIDEPDGEKRAAIVAEREAQRQADIAALYADAMAIEANLERHHPPYRELVADGRYWDDVSRIDAVRLLLQRIDTSPLPRDDHDLVDAAVYLAIPEDHRFRLATMAFALLAPGEAQRKN